VGIPAARIERTSSADQPFPVGLFGLHRKIAFVRGVIAPRIAGMSSAFVGQRHEDGLAAVGPESAIRNARSGWE
jgi:hypothetical protein